VQETDSVDLDLESNTGRSRVVRFLAVRDVRVIELRNCQEFIRELMRKTYDMNFCNNCVVAMWQQQTDLIEEKATQPGAPSMDISTSSSLTRLNQGQTMHMLTCTAKVSPAGITTATGDMYLVAAAKDGDQQAYTELCRRHSQVIFRRVLRITGNTADAEDALQEALLKAYIHIGGFEGRSAFSSWLTRIAINSALMLLRKKRSQPVCSFESGPDADDFKLPEPMETSHNPEESCIQNALENELAQAIRSLSPGLRVVIQIRHREEAPLAQIAKTLGISESAVKSRLLRARSQIRMRLDKNRCLAGELTRGERS
jgi:RNA polymerase sigma factor (sigma-70 family)